MRLKKKYIYISKLYETYYIDRKYVAYLLIKLNIINIIFFNILSRVKKSSQNLNDWMSENSPNKQFYYVGNECTSIVNIV